MDNKDDKIRKLDKDELEAVTGGGILDFFEGRKNSRLFDSTTGTTNTNNPKDLKNNRPMIIKS